MSDPLSNRKIILQTDRLILRLAKLSDAADYFAFCKDPSTSRYSEWMPHESIAQTKAYLRCLRRNPSDDSLDFAIVRKDLQRVIGSCGFTRLNLSLKTGEIGYCLAADARGCGYGFEAIRALCAYGFGQLHLNRIEARVVCENTPSIALLERLGFSREGRMKKGAFIKGKTCDLFLYAQTDDEFAKQR